MFGWGNSVWGRKLHFEAKHFHNFCTGAMLTSATFGGVWKPNELGFVFGWKYSFWRTKLYIFIILQVPWLCQQWLKWRSKKSSHDWVTGWRIFKKKWRRCLENEHESGYTGGHWIHWWTEIAWERKTSNWIGLKY